MVKPSTEAVQPLGSTFSEQEFHGQWEEVLTGARGRRLEAAAMARGVVSLSISSELRAGLDAEVWLWSGGSWGRGDEELCEALSGGAPAGTHQGPPVWANSTMGLLTANAGRLGIPLHSAVGVDK